MHEEGFGRIEAVARWGGGNMVCEQASRIRLEGFSHTSASTRLVRRFAALTAHQPDSSTDKHQTTKLDLYISRRYLQAYAWEHAIAYAQSEHAARRSRFHDRSSSLFI